MDSALLHLFRLVSPTLPVGAYSYSRGLEAAVEAGHVHDEASAEAFVLGSLGAVVAPLDVAVLVRIHRALGDADEASAQSWSQFLSASRESRELQLEDHQMGRALYRLLRELDALPAQTGQADGYHWLSSAGFTTLFAVAARHHGVDAAQAALGYLWAQADNQVSCAVRLIPLGQTAGQRILCRAIDALPAMVDQALSLPDAGVGGFAPALGLLSARHEAQYSRLFRS